MKITKAEASRLATRLSEEVKAEVTTLAGLTSWQLRGLSKSMRATARKAERAQALIRFSTRRTPRKRRAA